MSDEGDDDRNGGVSDPATLTRCPKPRDYGLGDQDRVNQIAPTVVESTDYTETVMHLVQDEQLIAELHEIVLPPDEYYEELATVLAARLKGADPSLVEHVVALAGAFDTAAAFGLSFGVKKFQFMQH